MKWVLAIVAVLICIASSFLLLNRGVVVTIRNVGTETLSGVVVHVTGNAYPIGDIQVGSERSVQVSPSGESHVEIEHSKGRLIVSTYFESGYHGKVSVEVTRDEVKRVQDEVRTGII